MITTRLNVLGIDLAENQIDAILDFNDNSEEVTFRKGWLAGFFRLDQFELTRIMLTRYVQADTRMTRISVGSNQEDIHTHLVNTLASAKRCYSYGEFIACIELCALHVEMLVNYLCITSREILENALDKLSADDRDKINSHIKSTYFSNLLGQRLRLRWMLNGQIILSNDNNDLIQAHELRIQYFHRWSAHSTPAEEDALTILERISRVSAEHLELLGANPREFNQVNLDRVTNYMQIFQS